MMSVESDHKTTCMEDQLQALFTLERRTEVCQRGGLAGGADIWDQNSRRYLVLHREVCDVSTRITVVTQPVIMYVRVPVYCPGHRILLRVIYIHYSYQICGGGGYQVQAYYDWIRGSRWAVIGY